MSLLWNDSVRRGEGVLALKGLEEGIDRVASELAIQRLEKELAELEEELLFFDTSAWSFSRYPTIDKLMLKHMEEELEAQKMGLDWETYQEEVRQKRAAAIKTRIEGIKAELEHYRSILDSGS